MELNNRKNEVKAEAKMRSIAIEVCIYLLQSAFYLFTRFLTSRS